MRLAADVLPETTTMPLHAAFARQPFAQCMVPLRKQRVRGLRIKVQMLHMAKLATGKSGTCLLDEPRRQPVMAAGALHRITGCFTAHKQRQTLTCPALCAHAPPGSRRPAAGSVGWLHAQAVVLAWATRTLHRPALLGAVANLSAMHADHTGRPCSLAIGTEPPCCSKTSMKWLATKPRLCRCFSQV